MGMRVTSVLVGTTSQSYRVEDGEKCMALLHLFTYMESFHLHPETLLPFTQHDDSEICRVIDVRIVKC